MRWPPDAFSAPGARAHKESACKPGSVESNHSSGICVAADLGQPTRKARGPRVERLRARPSLFGLAPDGVCLAASGYPSRGALLPHLFTLARSPPFSRWVTSAVCFLWHFPSARAAQTLSGVLPNGARTFLQRVATPAVARPTPGRSLPGNRGTDSNQPRKGSGPISVPAAKKMDPTLHFSTAALLLPREPRPRGRPGARRWPTAPCAAARSARRRAWQPSRRRVP